MFHAHGLSKQNCTLLAVLCGKMADEPRDGVKRRSTYPFPELTSAGRLEVHTITNPTVDRFREVLKSTDPNIIYFQGSALKTRRRSLPRLGWQQHVYLEVPNGEKVAEALHSKGIPYVIFWKNTFSSYAASHFRHALFSVVQSSCSHTWDAFQLAHATFRLYCTRNNHVTGAGSQNVGGKVEPCLLGDVPKIHIAPPERYQGEEEGSSDTLPIIKVYDDDVDVGFLICGVPCTLDACVLGSLEDGLNIRGSKLQNRVRVVTMRCDLTTCSSSHISLLVSGSAEACFDDQLLESHIKNELIEKSPPVHALPTCEGSQSSSSDPRKSSSIACGSSAFEVRMKIPSWAAQVLKQLAPQLSYRSLVALGIASIQGSSVASFEREDAERLLFFCARPAKELPIQVDNASSGLPAWFKPPAPTRKRPRSTQGVKFPTSGNRVDANGGVDFKLAEDGSRGRALLGGGSRMMPLMRVRHRPKVPAMRPIPYARRQKALPCRSQAKSSLHAVPIAKHSLMPPAISHRRSLSSSFHAQQIISLNPLPLKKHGCGRAPIHACSEGPQSLVPQGGISEFPDAILNAKRLDLYNLYREVFSKMRNHTMTNKMTGVGNTLKRHYETYLLEYELAHDDVDGECCLLCHSSEAGDWVNCGLCGEWAHFGCDKRQGLGAFKDYAKMDGLEYICPTAAWRTTRGNP
ncbi:unnamed protein product [Spirodela intermedia]|uniref:Uncharacterized protein n=1 Tax=Spirodela intermedia TaxID=51605 RepID=A0A7I8INJ5_SPIIN|nr:unnamed protein product [Spirodela intermedia]CAA6658708.1 unnamed protein product [Spirodela intermedia]